jgi:hypothetical protein
MVTDHDVHTNELPWRGEKPRCGMGRQQFDAGRAAMGIFPMEQAWSRPARFISTMTANNNVGGIGAAIPSAPRSAACSQPEPTDLVPKTVRLIAGTAAKSTHAISFHIARQLRYGSAAAASVSTSIIVSSNLPRARTVQSRRACHCAAHH